MERRSVPISTKRSSASARYWKARLQVLKRPAVWGSVLALLLPFVFLAHYWRDPAGFVFTRNALSNDRATNDEGTPDSLNGEEPTVTSPVVSDASTLLEVEVPAVPNQAAEGGQSADSATQATLLDALLSAPLPELGTKLPQAKDSGSRSLFAAQSRSNEASQIRGSNESLSLSPNLFTSTLLAPTLFASTTTQSPTNSGLGSSVGSNQTAVPLSPLQLALDRSMGRQTTQNAGDTASETQTEPQSNLTAQAMPNAAGQVMPWLVPNGQYARPLGTQVGTQTYIPQTSPFPGTTGYTVPSALRPTTPYYSNYPAYSNYSNSYFNGAYSNYGYLNSPYSTVTPGYAPIPQLAPTIPTQTLPISPYGRPPGYNTAVPVPNFGIPTTTVTPQPSPFSIPRTPPGRYIGGGEINTFSNP